MLRRGVWWWVAGCGLWGAGCGLSNCHLPCSQRTFHRPQLPPAKYAHAQAQKCLLLQPGHKHTSMQTFALTLFKTLRGVMLYQTRVLPRIFDSVIERKQSPPRSALPNSRPPWLRPTRLRFSPARSVYFIDRNAVMQDMSTAKHKNTPISRSAVDLLLHKRLH